jgi:hypothetical protein
MRNSGLKQFLTPGIPNRKLRLRLKNRKIRKFSKSTALALFLSNSLRKHNLLPQPLPPVVLERQAVPADAVVDADEVVAGGNKRLPEPLRPQ